MRENWKVLLFLLTFISFCFFSFVLWLVSLFFRYFFLFGKRGWEKEWIRLPFLYNSFLWKRERGATGKIRRKFSLFFFLKFPLFFFLIPLLFFSFGEGEWTNETLKKFVLRRIIYFYKNTCCLSKPQILILGQNCLAFAKCKCRCPRIKFDLSAPLYCKTHPRFSKDHET